MNFILTYHNGLQNFVDNRRQNSLFIVKTQVGEDLGQVLGLWTIERAQRDVYCLQIFATRRDCNRSWTCANIKDNRPMQPRNHEMCALANHVLLNTLKSIEYNRSMSSINLIREYKLN